jgi:hypothetical protein
LICKKGVMVRGLRAAGGFFFFSSELSISVPREMKNYLASWRLSADTGANAREKQGDRRTKP